MFDRSAITEGRRIQDFGLCDLKGDYQQTMKLRGKGWLVVTFFSPEQQPSKSVLSTLKEWAGSLPGDKVSLLAVLTGDRGVFEAFKASEPMPFPVVWDIEEYWTANWGLSALPTTFVTDTAGRVLDKIVGADTAALAEAKTNLTSLIAKAAAAKAAADAAAAAAAAAAPAPTPAPVATAAAPAAPAATPKADKDSGGKSKSSKK